MNIFTKANSSSFLRKLLMEPEYGIARHLLLIAVLVVTALNQSFMTLGKGMEVLGYKIFIQALFLFITYLFICYFNLRILIPRYLLKKRYVQYTVYLAVTILLIVIVQTLEERTVLIQIGILDEFYTLPRIVFNVFSSFSLILLCISGCAMTVLLKHWMTDNEKITQLEKQHIQSEVEHLKEQVSPHLLFNILNRTASLAKHHPDKSSDMLIKLSRLLRYQLYDCNRERVLLSAEIKFVHNYLMLEQMYSNAFEFNIQSDKECSHVLVSPLLFISFVQATVIKIHPLEQKTQLRITFSAAEERMISFTCHCEIEGVFSDIDFSKISKRLDILYKERYQLAVAGNEVRLKLEV